MNKETRRFLEHLFEKHYGWTPESLDDIINEDEYTNQFKDLSPIILEELMYALGMFEDEYEFGQDDKIE